MILQKVEGFFYKIAGTRTRPSDWPIRRSEIVDDVDNLSLRLLPALLSIEISSGYHASIPCIEIF